MVRIGSHSGTIVCKEGYIGVTNNIGFHAGILRCKDMIFVNNKIVGYRSGVYTCNKLVVTDKLTVIGPVSFYNKQGTKVIKGPIEIDKDFTIEDGQTSRTKHKYTYDELAALSFPELKEIGKKFRVRGRSKEGLIQDILDVQAGKKKPEY